MFIYYKNVRQKLARQQDTRQKKTLKKNNFETRLKFSYHESAENDFFSFRVFRCVASCDDDNVLLIQS